MVRVCFVCLGNICRSPTAEAVMVKLVRDAGLTDCVEIDSAGTGGWHEGEQADPRTREAARRRGFDVTSIARQVRREDFERFDYLVAMDQSNHANLLRMAKADLRHKVHLLRRFDPDAADGAEVPDPYYGGPGGFDEVLDICEAACRGLLAHLRSTHGI